MEAPSSPSPGWRSAADWPPAAPRRRLELQPWIDRLAFQREYAKDALVNASEGLSLDEPFEPFDPQCELAQRQRSLPGKPTFTQALEMLGQGVLGPVDDPEVLTAAALHRGLQQATRRARHELQWLDDSTLAARLRQVLPPGSSRSFTGLISELHDLIGRAHQQAVALLDKAADRAHVPDVVFVRVHRALGGHHVERGNADVSQRLDGPAVVAIRPRKPFGKLQTNLVTFEECPDIDTARAGGFERPHGFAQGHASGCSNRRVLLPNKVERLRRPWHQLAVEAHPIGVQSLPEPRCVEGCPHCRQQLTLQRGIFKESTAGARVTDATLVFENTESLAGDVLIPAHDDDGAGAHVLLLNDDRRYAVGSIVRERLGGMLEQTLDLAGLAW